MGGGIQVNRVFNRYSRLFILILLLFTHCRAGAGQDGDIDTPQVRFENLTEKAGLVRYTPSFSIVVADVDRDGKDDLFVGHHGFPPALYLNRNLNFLNVSNSFPSALKRRRDRHGFTFIDFDNDGDKDFAVAGGGADGIGVGVSNEIYKNLLIETKRLEFIDVSEDSDIGDPSGRTRHLMPVPNLNGSKVDLYSTGLHKRRKNSKNIYGINNSSLFQIKFNADEHASLHQAIESDGKDLFFDFDRDGLMDFLNVGHGQVHLYRNNFNGFSPFNLVPDQFWRLDLPSDLDKIRGVITAVSADFNNDGFPDLYLGSDTGLSNSDHVVGNSDEIHFSVQNQGKDSVDSITFRTKATHLKINFMEHLPALGKPRTDATDIFIGADMHNPIRRTAQIESTDATGKPESVGKPGIYIWYDKEYQHWQVLWKYEGLGPAESKGIFYAEGIEQLQEEDMETFQDREAQDYIVINRKGKGWKVLKPIELKHRERTNHVTAADFNNDGYIDVVGVRARPNAAQENGNPFIMLNHGDLNFTKQEILQNSEDDIFHADLIVHGFFNDDGLPDLFFTNGSGLLPGHVGPYQFWVNVTESPNGYLLLELEGVRANRDAIGAQIELYDVAGALLGYRELGANFGRGQSSHKIHFGLGNKRGPFYVKIRWPGSSIVQQFPVTTNSVMQIRQQ